jgi:ApaG protein
MATRPAHRPTYEAITRGVTVRVRPTYLPLQSEPAISRHVWAYTVEIENRGPEPIQLITRHWIITDAMNRVEEVKGDGVRGEQPMLKPNEAFRYTSSCPLPTASGAMRGSYQMLTEGGELFDVAIPEFSLHLPEATRRMN